MRRRRGPVTVVAALAVALLTLPLPAAEDSNEIARARSLLAGAGTVLQAAEDDDTRLAALGRAVGAHEAALSALRDGLRRLAVAEARLTGEIDAEGATLSRLLAALQSISRAPASALLAVRGGPLEATRAAMVMGGIAPELDRRVIALGQRLETLHTLRGFQDEVRIEARDALAVLQELRAGTTEALGSRDRSGLVTRPELRRQAKAAAARALDLDGLAAALAQAGVGHSAGFSRAALPAAGRVTARFGEPDPWGRNGRGWSIAAPAFAQVIAPWDATVRYAGPLIDYGQVVVLEPETDYLVVFAGLAHIDREPGEAVLAGEKLGDLGGDLPTSDQFLLEALADDGQTRQETFYVEIRRSGEPIDPAEWFDTTGSEAIR